MEWYHYLAGFFAGAFLANAVPHFVHGITGERFPSPFASPPGVGLSSPTTNVAWALANIALSFYLFQLSKASFSQPWSLLVPFLGLAVLSLWMSVCFQGKHSK